MEGAKARMIFPRAAQLYRFRNDIYNIKPIFDFFYSTHWAL
jgi:hypothetical protein